jgi:hypothetical protein
VACNKRWYTENKPMHKRDFEESTLFCSFSKNLTLILDTFFGGSDIFHWKLQFSSLWSHSCKVKYKEVYRVKKASWKYTDWMLNECTQCTLNEWSQLELRC